MPNQQTYEKMLRSLRREQKLITIMIDALVREDKAAIEYYQEEYKNIKQETDICLNKICMGITRPDELKEIIQTLDNAIELIVEHYLIKLSNEQFSSVQEDEKRTLLDIVVYYLRYNELSKNTRNSIIEIFSSKFVSSEAIRSLLAGNIEYSNNLSNPHFPVDTFTEYQQQNQVISLLKKRLQSVIDLDIEERELKQIIGILDCHGNEDFCKTVERNRSICETLEHFFETQKLYQELSLAALPILMKKYKVSPPMSEGMERSPFIEEIITNAGQIASEYDQGLQQGFPKSKKLKVIYAKK